MKYAMDGQMSIFDLDSWSLKMSPDSCPQESQKAKTSESSLKRSSGSKIQLPLFLDLRSGHRQDVSWEMGGLLLGEYTMLSFGESPSVGVDSVLSEILQDNVPETYYLSKKACLGILRRAEKRKKSLPEPLMKALLEQSI